MRTTTTIARSTCNESGFQAPAGNQSRWKSIILFALLVLFFVSFGLRLMSSWPSGEDSSLGRRRQFNEHTHAADDPIRRRFRQLARPSVNKAANDDDKEELKFKRSHLNSDESAPDGATAVWPRPLSGGADNEAEQSSARPPTMRTKLKRINTNHNGTNEPDAAVLYMRQRKRSRHAADVHGAAEREYYIYEPRRLSEVGAPKENYAGGSGGATRLSSSSKPPYDFAISNNSTWMGVKGGGAVSLIRNQEHGGGDDADDGDDDDDDDHAPRLRGHADKKPPPLVTGGDVDAPPDGSAGNSNHAAAADNQIHAKAAQGAAGPDSTRKYNQVTRNVNDEQPNHHLASGNLFSSSHLGPILRSGSSTAKSDTQLGSRSSNHDKDHKLDFQMDASVDAPPGKRAATIATRQLPALGRLTAATNIRQPATPRSICVGTNETFSWVCTGLVAPKDLRLLKPSPKKLQLSDVEIISLSDYALEPHVSSLRDFSIEGAAKLKTIEPDTFANISHLRVVYIFQAPELTSFNAHSINPTIGNAANELMLQADAISGQLPELAIIRIQHSGLRRWPSMRRFKQEKILTSIDLDNNQIESLGPEPINIRAELLNLEFNRLQSIEENTFNGSEIGTISMSGNRELAFIHRNAFANLHSLVHLDLSGTSVAHLPTAGLEHLRRLIIRNNYALKQIPSIYVFPSLEEAHLTYAYHCCSFKYPQTHDPEAYAEHQFLQREIDKVCGKSLQSNLATAVAAAAAESAAAAAAAASRISHRVAGHLAMDRNSNRPPKTPPPLLPAAGRPTRSNPTEPLAESAADSNGPVLALKKDGRVNENPKHMQIDFEGIFAHEEPITTTTRPTTTSTTTTTTSTTTTTTTTPVTVTQSTTSTTTPFSAILTYWGFDLAERLIELASDTPSRIDGKRFDLGRQWELLQNVECGELVLKNKINITCTPVPDAFNPCEDIMGYPILRIAVWFVVACSILGNLSVIIVLSCLYDRLSVPKFLQLNLAIGDFFMGIYLTMLASADLFTVGKYFNYASDWQHGYGCQVAGATSLFASQLSIFTLTVITFERYYTITYSIDLNMRLQLGWAARIMLIGWLYAFVSATLPIFANINTYKKASICLPMRITYKYDRLFLMILLMIDASAFLVIFICYLRMYLLILRQKTQASMKEKTIAMRMALLVFTDFACWAPIIFFGVTALFGYPMINVTNSKILIVFFYPLNSVANPFLYVLSTRQYKRDLNYCMNRWRHWRKNLFKPKQDSGMKLDYYNNQMLNNNNHLHVDGIYCNPNHQHCRLHGRKLYHHRNCPINANNHLYDRLFGHQQAQSSFTVANLDELAAITDVADHLHHNTVSIDVEPSRNADRRRRCVLLRFNPIRGDDEIDREANHQGTNELRSCNVDGSEDVSQACQYKHYIIRHRLLIDK